MMAKKMMVSLSMVLCLCLMMSTGFASEDSTLSYYAFWCGSLEPESYVEQYVENLTDLDIQIKKVAHTDKEAVNLMLATGDMPDCGWFEQSISWMQEEELIRGIPVEMVKTYAPDYIALCDQFPILYALALDPEDPTQFMALPSFYIGSVNEATKCMFLRYDWIQKLGIELDVHVEKLSDQLYIADNGPSKEVFEKILDGFVNGDPDGNGEKDTYGLIKDWDISLATAQGILYGTNMEVDGKPQEWFTNPAMKELLQYTQHLYQEGLIYPETFTLQWGEDWELITSGKAGVLSGNAVAAVWLNSWANNRPPRTLFEADHEAQLLMIPGVAGPDGEVHHARAYSPVAGEYFYVNADVSDEKLKNVLKFFNRVNFTAADEEQATMLFGEKDVDWKWDNNGEIEKLSDLVNGDKGTQVFNRNIVLDVSKSIVLDPLYKLGGKYYLENEGGIWNHMQQYPYKVDLYNETEADEIKTEYGKDWEATYRAYFMNVILGKANVESDWDAYIEELNRLEYDAYLEELEKAPVLTDVLAQYSK